MQRSCAQGTEKAGESWDDAGHRDKDKELECSRERGSQ